MENELKKKFGLITAICMVAGIVIGSGIFFKATNVLTSNNGDMMKSVLTVLTVGIMMTVCAYTFSILAGRHSNVNGLVDYAEATTGRLHAYTVGWFVSTVYYPVVVSTLAFVSSSYTCALFGIQSENVRLLITLGYLICSFVLNIVSPKISGKFQVSTMAIKLVPLLVMAVAGTAVGLINGQTLENLTRATSDMAVSGGSFFGAVVAFAFAYEGWIIATCINAELRDAKRNLPKALIIGTFLVIGVYIAYFVGLFSVLSTDEILATSGSNELPRVAFTALFGNKVFGTVIYVFVIISCLGTMNGVMIATCRGFYSLAVRNQGPAPERVSKISNLGNMPAVSSAIGFSIALIWMLQWEFGLMRGRLPAMISFENDELPVITLYAFYIPIFINMMIKENDLHPVKRFVLPSLSVCASLFMIYAAFAAYKIQALYYLIIFALIMLVGIMFYRDRKGRSLIYRFFNT